MKKLSRVVSSMLLTTHVLYGSVDDPSKGKPLLSHDQQVVAVYAKEIDKLRQENNLLRQENNKLLEDRNQLAININAMKNDLNNLSKLQNTPISKLQSMSTDVPFPSIPWELIWTLGGINAIVIGFIWWASGNSNK
ncbi:MAG TPA: hypothetical protein VGW78_02270 [Candidatus Babeliales bacterium]|jgi:hypothetical protein|nr:hypothetical protein [Candidatus Babeliales bacterium]